MSNNCSRETHSPSGHLPAPRGCGVKRTIDYPCIKEYVIYNSPTSLPMPFRPPGQESQDDAVPSGQNPSRRFTSRVAGLSELWVFWNCKKHDGLSRVRDLSAGGLCLLIEKSERMTLGEKVHLSFLTQEGQIRADAIVRHMRPGNLGLKFVAIREEDRAHLTALMTRVRSLSRPQGRP